MRQKILKIKISIYLIQKTYCVLIRKYNIEDDQSNIKQDILRVSLKTEVHTVFMYNTKGLVKRKLEAKLSKPTIEKFDKRDNSGNTPMAKKNDNLKTIR